VLVKGAQYLGHGIGKIVKIAKFIRLGRKLTESYVLSQSGTAERETYKDIQTDGSEKDGTTFTKVPIQNQNSFCVLEELCLVLGLVLRPVLRLRFG